MFSYRHGFHAGNHADVLKHLALIGTLRHLTAKPTALTVVDTHAGAGLYRLDGDFAGTSGEAQEGVLKLIGADDAPAAVAEYLAFLKTFNPHGGLRIYPGSPFVAQAFLRDDPRDKLWLFELHPTDSKALAGHVSQLDAGKQKQVTVERVDGFEGLKPLLPPPSRRGLVLIDPSYEIKTDYARVTAKLQEALKRFATGCYFVWYPVIPRPEAHELPRRLKTIANNAGKGWLHATLNVGHAEREPGAPAPKQGLTASGIFLVNPPHTLKPALQEALPWLVEKLGRGRGKGHLLESAGS